MTGKSVRAISSIYTFWNIRLLSPRNNTHFAVRRRIARRASDKKKCKKKRKTQKISLTRIWRPCHVCGHRAPRRPRPQLPPRERVVAAEEEAVGIGGVLGPYLPGVGCGGDREHRGHYHVDRIALRLHRHHPRGNPRAARHHRTAITKLLKLQSWNKYKILVRTYGLFYSNTLFQCAYIPYNTIHVHSWLERLNIRNEIADRDKLI